jgi:hypothetical protein
MVENHNYDGCANCVSSLQRGLHTLLINSPDKVDFPEIKNHEIIGIDSSK